MIYLKPIPLETLDDLRAAVQQAVFLEHYTIPPYLTANFTLYNTGNDDIYNLIGSIVGEEMLHMSISSNLLTAIGGNPIINKPPFIPIYPHCLPGGVEGSLIVPIKKFSLDLVQNAFMVIEEPENIIPIEAVEDQLTIGMFYDNINDLMTRLEKEAQANGATIFTGDPASQMTFPAFFPEKMLFPITDLATASRGINIIVDQGEGTTKDPFVADDDDPTTTPEPAHYYRFKEIVKGKQLVVDPNAPSGFSFTGDPVPYIDGSIPNMPDNPKMADYPVNSQAYLNSKLFNYTYTSLLNSLHRAFNGEPNEINTAMGLMFSVRLYALKLLATTDPNNPAQVCGPSYEYVTDEDLTTAEQEALKG